MKRKRQLFTVSYVLLVAMLCVTARAGAQDLCPYDASGNYTYDANRTPTYLFFGDGQITYDGSIPWYMDDVMACYNTYQNAGYFQYFPKCDLDGDSAVSIGEVYDIYYRVHPVNQTDQDAQKICSQMFRTGPFYFCHPSRYNRTVTDRDAIVANYPAAGAIFDGVSGSLGQGTLQWEYNQLRCSTPGAFNPAAFDALNECYLGTTTCEGQPCQVATIDFSQYVDPYLTEADYSDVAQNFGGICERVATPHQDPVEVPGIYSMKYASDGNYWIYNVRATAQCVGDACACDHRYELYTHKDYPGNVYFTNETNLSTTACTDPRFPGSTPVQGDCSGPNVVEDTQSGLCWQSPEHTVTVNQGDAAGYCAGLELDGYDDWRVPTISELRTIVQNCPSQMDGGACGITDTCLDSTTCSGGCSWCSTGGDYLDSALAAHNRSHNLWSSSVDSSNSNGYVLEFYTAYIRSLNPADQRDVRCVRDASGTQCNDADGDGVCDANDQCPGEDDLLNTDGDALADCLEECDTDPNKTDPGVCDCGTPDDDANGNGTVDCLEPCWPDLDSDLDSVCDASDQCPGEDDLLNTDGDAVVDCLEECPADPNKTSQGVCGCGTPDDDANGNGTIDCLEPCWPDQDSDNDTVCDASDQCPGEDDLLNTDGDPVVDCLEECPTDPNKISQGVCGCGTPDDDANGNGTVDCLEPCWPDLDSDNDTVCDASDQCPGEDDLLNTDGDPVVDCLEECPTDPNKTSQGVCGCGTPDDDANGNGTIDCLEPCWPDQDSDNDTVCDASDQCPGEDDLLNTDGDPVVDCLEECPTDPNKISQGVCGCGTPDDDANGNGTVDCLEPCWPDLDSDNDGVCDAVDECPGHDDNLDADADTVPDGCDICPGGDDRVDTNGNGIPDACEEPSSIVIEDFENTTDTWPWTPWETPGPNGWSAIDPAAAHDGAQGLDIHEWHYRTDVSFGAVENEMITMWCYNGTAQGCRLGFGADGTGRYEVRLMAFQKKLVLGDSHNVTDFNGDPVPWTTGAVDELATTHLSADIGNAWYKMEVHVGAGGAVDAQLWAEDGTPIGSVQHTFGAFPATGIAIYGGNDEYVDTIELGPSSGVCIDIDQDGVCDVDDMCRGDDTTGNDDGDGVCNDSDICWGIDLLGDADGDGDCDEYVCPGNVPAYYDVTTSAIDWIASGTCAEAHYGVGGIPVCQQAEWQDHVDAIADIIAAYPFTQVAADTQIWRREPYMIMCSGFSGSPDNAPMFDDLNGCYHGNSEWNSNYSIIFINFDWGVNAYELADRYGQRAAQFGGACETNYNNSPPAYLSGFHVDPDQSSGTWRMWDVKAHSQHDASTEDFACRAHLRVYTDSTQPGEVFEDSLVNYSTGVCTDSRFADPLRTGQ